MSKKQSLISKFALLTVLLSTGAFVINAFADRIVNNYDASGNRINSEKTIIFTRGANKGQAPEPEMFLDSLSSTRITIYPNPTEGDLRVDITGIEDFSGSELTINAANGAFLTRINPLQASNEVDMTTYKNGIYLFVIKINDEITTWKIIKK